MVPKLIANIKFKLGLQTIPRQQSQSIDEKNELIYENSFE